MIKFLNEIKVVASHTQESCNRQVGACHSHQYAEKYYSRAYYGKAHRGQYGYHSRLLLQQQVKYSSQQNIGGYSG